MSENTSIPISFVKPEITEQEDDQKPVKGILEIFKKIPGALWETLKKTFVYKGRATRLEFWSFVIVAFLIRLMFTFFGYVLINLSYKLAEPVFIFDLIILLALIVIGLPLFVRRLHDLGMTGFWLLYLSYFGLPVVFMVNILNVDTSCNSAMEKISKVCTNWVSWLLLPFFWFFGAPVCLFILMLYKGKDEENQFGPSPYTK